MTTELFSNQKIPNILIFDDVQANLVLLGHILKDIGYKVRPVPNGTLALKVAENRKPDLFFGHNEPDMDGFEYRRRFKDDPIIMISNKIQSALNDTKDIVKALNSVEHTLYKAISAEKVKAREANPLRLYQQNSILKNKSEKNKFYSILPMT